jgi:NADH-quinone oxidoreductase subunit G
MPPKNVHLTIDGKPVKVPSGTLVVDAAKRIGTDVPVFCYHPKMDPVGMCRMCLVEIGRPAHDRATGEPILDEDGKQVMHFGPVLETACTTPVGEGWEIRVASEKAILGRNQIVEYLLTSHPLDCPICDKGGECPLQNLTMDHGPGESRFLFDDKIQLAKHVPLGDLIFLDRERCIQCARCTRFQDEIVDDPVISFYQRGRRLEIMTHSEPGFDSYFSGNTTDICPVGALTTADFRFGARPWELNAAASICPHCPVGCNLTLNTRREAMQGGTEVIKRVMPRQNEQVNEIWICDKGRFGHHFARSPDRLTTPLVRKDGQLVEASWEQALERAARGLKSAKRSVIGIAGERLSNEDYFNFRRLIRGIGGKAISSGGMAGGELVRRYGLGPGSNLGSLGRRDAVLVIASDLHEEAPIWWLRLKQAAERGAKLIVANARPTRLDKHATHRIRYPVGEAVTMALGLLAGVSSDKGLKRFAGDDSHRDAAAALGRARNVIIFYGNEGLDYAGSDALARACARLLIDSDHVGKPNNGLVAVWPHANSQGAWDLGIRPARSGLQSALEGAKAVYLMGADPVGKDAAIKAVLETASILIVHELFLTPTAEMADVVLPAQSFVEREGTFTSGERRVQRFYPAVTEAEGPRPDWRILAEAGERLGIELERRGASLVFAQIAKSVGDYRGTSYEALSAVDSQWPEVGGEDLYFGGTAYANRQGLGVQLEPRGGKVAPKWKPPRRARQAGDLLLVPITKLYDSGTTMLASQMLGQRRARLVAAVHPNEAARMLVIDGKIELNWDGRSQVIEVTVDATVPEGVALIPRSVGLNLHDPALVTVTRQERA